jgi:CubicO group peptidase (beta-lactamase class C family)
MSIGSRGVRFDGVRRILRDAVAAGVFPGAVANVGSSDGAIWHEAFGRLTIGGPAPATTATIFDLASLTKVLATTTVAMSQVRRGLVSLDDRVGTFFPEWRGADREAVTVRDLLEHASGLPARLFDAPPDSRREFEHEICAMPLEYEPRSQSIYSDLGFILLGWLLEQRGGSSLADQYDEARRAVSAAEPDLANEIMTFDMSGALSSSVAPTLPESGDARRGRTLIGEVHDNYAAVLGGVAGHAGLFGTAAGVASWGRAVLRAARGGVAIPAPLSIGLVRQFLTKTAVPRSSRALGWDTMLPTSSCGTRMSAAAVGHVGFTGGSLWIDPQRDRYFVLLSNRACGGGSLDAIRSVRRSFHDELGDL